MIIICKSIQEKELKPLEKYFDIQAIKKAALKAKNGLGEVLPATVENSHVVKIYLTGKPAGRVCFLILLAEGDVVPLVLRLKKDKKIGENMSMQNTAFKQFLEKNIKLVLRDIESGEYVEIGI